MSPVVWIVAGGILMGALTLVGALTLALPDALTRRLLLPLVAFAAGALLGGALFHLLPAALLAPGSARLCLGWTAAGFGSFLALEQFLHWHHCHRASAPCRQPRGILVLLGDALHNLLGGLAVGAAFLTDTRLGLTAWLAAAAHEIPQELGDFGVLMHAGWKARRALLLNLVSGSTFLVGGLASCAVSPGLETGSLLAFAAGNFIYIAASDLVPEVNRQRTLGSGLLHVGCFCTGTCLLFLLAVPGDR